MVLGLFGPTAKSWLYIERERKTERVRAREKAKVRERERENSCGHITSLPMVLPVITIPCIHRSRGGHEKEPSLSSEAKDNEIKRETERERER